MPAPFRRGRRGRLEAAAAGGGREQLAKPLRLNSLLQSPSHNRIFSPTLHYFSLLRASSPPPDEFTFTSVLKACAALLSVPLGKQLHVFVLKRAFISNLFVRNSLVDMYFKFNRPADAGHLFDEMPVRDIVSWNTLVAGHSSCGDLISSREVFDRMPERNVGVLVHLGALDLGRWIDWYIGRRGMELGLFLGNALSDMYAKCGCIDEARSVFGRMLERDVISWNIIISTEAMHDHVDEAISGFPRMLDEGIKPNDITFMGILSACTHAGLVDVGLIYFDVMREEFQIVVIL